MGWLYLGAVTRQYVADNNAQNVQQSYGLCSVINYAIKQSMQLFYASFVM